MMSLNISYPFVSILFMEPSCHLFFKNSIIWINLEIEYKQLLVLLLYIYVEKY